MKKPLKIAVTGGIGSGKSLFCKFIEEKGFSVIKADPMAKELMNFDPNVKRQITGIFGEDIYSDGRLNTMVLAKKVFSDSENVKKINSIVHPAVISQIEKDITAKFADEDVVFVEAALIYEAKIEKLFDKVILIIADEEVKINRILQRDNTTREEIVNRMKNQIPDDIKKTKAHFIFLNNGPEEELKRKVELLLSLVTLK